MSCSDIESFHLVNNAPVNSLDVHGEQLNFMYFVTPRTAALWLRRKTQNFSGTNQKPKRLQLSGTMPPGALPPFFTFLCTIYSNHLDFPSPPPPPHFRGRKLLPLHDLLVFPYSLQPILININCFPGNVLLYTITAEKKSSLNFWTQSRCPESWKLHFRTAKLWKF